MKKMIVIALLATIVFAEKADTLIIEDITVQDSYCNYFPEGDESLEALLYCCWKEEARLDSIRIAEVNK